jgi:hypothetical protein
MILATRQKAVGLLGVAQPAVRDLDDARLVDEDVLRLQIAVDNSNRVQVGDRGAASVSRGSVN